MALLQSIQVVPNNPLVKATQAVPFAAKGAVDGQSTLVDVTDECTWSAVALGSGVKVDTSTHSSSFSLDSPGVAVVTATYSGSTYSYSGSAPSNSSYLIAAPWTIEAPNTFLLYYAGGVYLLNTAATALPGSSIAQDKDGNNIIPGNLLVPIGTNQLFSHLRPSVNFVTCFLVNLSSLLTIVPK
ncbi:MAG TPA: hypothetical protein VF815_05490 [Myxococcaceae bacterium]|jgi:hypothetical protein